MKLIPRSIIILTGFFCIILAGCTGQKPDSELATGFRPNIIFIMADDMGYSEAGCYGQSYIKTPNIDQMAVSGMKFTQFYSGSPVCAPSRCVLMTGKHTGHSYIRDNGNPEEKNPLTVFPGQNPIPDSILTIGEILKSEGYTTACIGKWGLGHTGTSGNPGMQGFDLFYGFKCQVHAHNHYPEFLWRNDEMEKLEGNDRTLYGEQHSQDLFTREALRFINENKDTCFFLYLPFIIPHLSIQTSEPFLDMYKDSIPETDYKHKGYLPHPYPHAGYAGMITQMDDAVGQIVNEIERLGLGEETLIIFTSDNGPTYDRLGGSDSDFFESSEPLSGRKGSLLEGGIRVPMLATWEGKIMPGSISDLQFALWDVLSTLCEVSGSNTPQDTDGISFLPTLVGDDDQDVHESLYWEFPSYGGQAAMIKGEWKLLVRNLFSNEEAPSVQLFNLKNDIGETTDLSGDYPELVNEIVQEMKQSHDYSELFSFTGLENFYNK
jgi:arylsulfatase A